MTTQGFLKDIELDSTSGVDHPAHQVEGWMILKRDGSLDEIMQPVYELRDAIRKHNDRMTNLRKEIYENERRIDQRRQELEQVQEAHEQDRQKLFTALDALERLRQFTGSEPVNKMNSNDAAAAADNAFFSDLGLSN